MDMYIDRHLPNIHFLKSTTNFLGDPLCVVQRTSLSGFQPSTDTMQMECMVTLAPGRHTCFLIVIYSIWLTFNTWFHQMVPTNCTVLNLHIPGPERNCCPFLNLKLWFARLEYCRLFYLWFYHIVSKIL